MPERITGSEFCAAAQAVPVEAVKRLGHFTGTPAAVAGKVEPYIQAGLDYVFLVEHAPLADPATTDTAAANLAELTARLRGGRGLSLSGASTGGYLGVGDSR